MGNPVDAGPGEVPRQARLLKRLVIGFALLLVLAALFLVAVGVSRLDGTEGFGTATLPIPPGCEVVEMTAEGDRLVLALRGLGDCPGVVIADMKSGRLLGRFDFRQP
ncbi:MAG: hypothetical protein JNL25_11925 [Rhodospirillaceae bacterium]|nr:hypothetical protein [Rhodospirillaceae bacterium]